MKQEIESIVHDIPIPQSMVDVAQNKAMMERGGRGWTFMNTSLDWYNNVMVHFHNDSIGEILEEKNDRHEPTAVLDVMGFGAICYGLEREKVPFSAGYSLSLGHWNRKVSDHIYHITGNILDVHTWNKFAQHKKEHGVGKFGFVVWNPIGGFDPQYTTDSIVIYNELMRRVFDQVSVAGGMLLAEVPWWVTGAHYSAYKTWVNTMRSWNTTKNHPFCLELAGATHYLLLEKNPSHKAIPAIAE